MPMHAQAVWVKEVSKGEGLNIYFAQKLDKSELVQTVQKLLEIGVVYIQKWEIVYVRTVDKKWENNAIKICVK